MNKLRLNRETVLVLNEGTPLLVGGIAPPDLATSGNCSFFNGTCRFSRCIPPQD